MGHDESAAVSELISAERDRVLRDWLAKGVDSSINAAGSLKSASSPGQSLHAEAGRLLDAMLGGLTADPGVNFSLPAWQPLRDLLEAVSRSGAARGASAAETSSFIMALKWPLFSGLQERLIKDQALLAKAIWVVSTLVDRMSQLTLSAYQRSREEIIRRQQEELLELSTPVIKLWEGVLAAPMIGTLDSSRTQLVMESLLQRIVETGSEVAIIDITGVPTVDTLVAQHLLKTVTAIRLMGADCIISGIRPQIAQTIVQLGIELKGITTKATLADALALALKRSGFVVTRPSI